MHRSLVIWLLTATLMAWFCPPSHGGTYQLITGQNVTGEPIAPDANGVIIKLTATMFSDRIHWTNFTEKALKEMAAEDPAVKALVSAYILEEPDLPPEKRQRPAIKVNPVTRIARPDAEAGLGAFLSSPLGICLLILLYAANLYAGYQVSFYRSYNPLVVCALAAVLPLLGPIFFLCLPASVGSEAASEEEILESEEEAYAQAAVESAAGTAPEESSTPTLAPTPAKRIAPPTVYPRGQFTFNRRFFETKLAGFLRVVPGEAERDMVVCIESVRGRHVGNRIVRILPNELYFQVSKGGATSEVVIQFNDIKVVTVRHKDA